MRKCRVIEGKYAGFIGKATEVNVYGNVMFYSDRGHHPYRVCLNASQVEFLEWS